MKISSFGIVVFLGLFLGACQSKTEQPNLLVVGEEIPVQTMAVKNIETNQNINTTGLLSTENEARLSFKIGGIIDKILVREGQSVSRGQLLATLKVTEIDAQLEQAKLGLEKAKRDYERASNLHKDGVATLEQMQNAKTALEVATKTVEQIAFNQQFASIVSPVNGFVTKKVANVGEVVGAGMPILALNESNGQANWVLKTGVTDAEWARITIGQSAEVRFDAFPNQVFEATVYQKSQAADQNSGSFQVELKVQLGTEKPAIGMFGKAIIKSNQTQKGYIVPYNAVIEANGNKAFVFVPLREGKVKKVMVTIQSFDEKQIIVSEGLENVQEIIVSNSAFLNEQSRIVITK